MPVPYCHEQYVWSGRYIDAPVLRRWNSTSPLDDSTFDVTYYYTTDANFNVTAELSTAGAVQERYAYTPYGEVTVLDGDWTSDDGTPDHANNILYCGYFRDDETGLYHVRNRMYDAPLGRWLQRDPVGYADGLNLYCYVSCQPTIAIDPTGLRRWWEWIPVVATIGHWLETPEGAELEDYKSCKPSCRPRKKREILECQRCVDGLFTGYMGEYWGASLDRDALTAVAGGVLSTIGYQIVRRAASSAAFRAGAGAMVSGGILLVDAVLDVAIQISKTYDMKDALDEARRKYCH